VFITKKQTAIKGNKTKTFIVGIFNTAIPFVLFGYATLILSGGLTSVLNATIPMFGVIVAYFWFRDKMRIRASFGLLGGYLLMRGKITLSQQSVFFPHLPHY